MRFLKGVQRRIQERYIEPIADFSLRETDGEDIYADHQLRQTPLSLAPAIKDTQEVLLMIVQGLLIMGINPGEKNIIVSLTLFEVEKGVTGKELRRVYGRARYNPFTDSIAWENVR